MEVVIDPTPPDTVEVLAGLIAELDSETTRAGDFYDDVCEALCRLTSMERAGTLLYDPATRAVRFVGSHGVDKELIGEIEGTLDETPIAQRALAEDRVVEASEHLEREVPERYARFARSAPLSECGRRGAERDHRRSTEKALLRTAHSECSRRG